MEEREQLEAVALMARTDGWAVLSAWIGSQASAERLLGCPPDKFPAMQAEINAYRSVIAKVNEHINTLNQP